MTVKELREILEDVEDESLEVYLAIQPNWPFTYEIGEVVIMDDYHFTPSEDYDELEDDVRGVYLAEARQKCYLPEIVAQELDWP